MYFFGDTINHSNIILYDTFTQKNISSTMFLYNNVKNLYQKVVGPDMDVMGPHLFGYLGS